MSSPDDNQGYQVDPGYILIIAVALLAFTIALWVI